MSGDKHQAPCPHDGCAGVIKIARDLPSGVYRCVCHAIYVRLDWTVREVTGRSPLLVKLAGRREPRADGDPAECGTSYGHWLHRKHGTPLCDPCRKAKNARTSELRYERAERQRLADAAKLSRLLNPSPAPRRGTPHAHKAVNLGDESAPSPRREDEEHDGVK